MHTLFTLPLKCIILKKTSSCCNATFYYTKKNSEEMNDRNHLGSRDELLDLLNRRLQISRVEKINFYEFYWSKTWSTIKNKRIAPKYI